MKFRGELDCTTFASGLSCAENGKFQPTPHAPHLMKKTKESSKLPSRWGHAAVLLSLSCYTTVSMMTDEMVSVTTEAKDTPAGTPWNAPAFHPYQLGVRVHGWDDLTSGFSYNTLHQQCLLYSPDRSLHIPPRLSSQSKGQTAAQPFLSDLQHRRGLGTHLTFSPTQHMTEYIISLVVQPPPFL